MYCSGSGSNIPLSKDNQVKNTFPIIGFMSAIFLNIIIVFPRYIPILVPHDTFRCTYCTHFQNDPFLYQISTFHPSIQPNHIVSKLVTFTIVITQYPFPEPPVIISTLPSKRDSARSYNFNWYQILVLFGILIRYPLICLSYTKLKAKFHISSFPYPPTNINPMTLMTNFRF